jgi:hypothetical protein
VSGRCTYLFFLFICWHITVLSQQKQPYRLYSNNLTTKEGKLLTRSKDSITLKQRLTSIQLSHQKKGFVLANVDSLVIDSTKNVHLSYHKGPKFNGIKNQCETRRIENLTTLVRYPGIDAYQPITGSHRIKLSIQTIAQQLHQ